MTNPFHDNNREERCLAWTSWAIHASEAALAADEAAGGNMARGICSAIGRFHPNWLIANFDMIPAHCWGNAVQGITQAIQEDLFMPANPFGALRQAAHWGYDPLLVPVGVAAIWRPPYDAWQWFQEYRISNPEFRAGFGSTDMLAKLLENPSDLPPSWRNAMVSERHQNPGSRAGYFNH